MFCNFFFFDSLKFPLFRRSGPVHWDDPEGWDGEGVGKGGQDGEHMYTYG